jgi:hypothetical protein
LRQTEPKKHDLDQGFEISKPQFIQKNSIFRKNAGPRPGKDKGWPPWYIWRVLANAGGGPYGALISRIFLSEKTEFEPLPTASEEKILLTSLVKAGG